MLGLNRLKAKKTKNRGVLLWFTSESNPDLEAVSLSAREVANLSPGLGGL